MLSFSVVDKVSYKCTGRSAVEINTENERYTVACVFTLSVKSLSLNLQLNFTLLFGRLETKKRIARAARLFSSVNQSNHDLRSGVFVTAAVA